MADKQVGPFVLGPKLGDGGMGVVFKATYTKTGHDVALKLLPAELQDNERIVARFERELEILKKLKHPHIVQFYGGGRKGTQRFYAMELIPGGSLSQRLKERRQFAWEEVVDYGIQICKALAYAHANGIIHRDLKPGNLLLTREGSLKLSDFGIARDNGATSLTATGRTVGTYHYMAPEQINDGDVTHKSDLYALGCVLYELLTGDPPFHADSPAKIFYKHLNEKPPRAAAKALDCPVWLDNLIVHLLEKDPAKRPFDAETVQRALEEVREKMATQQSLAQHAISGHPTALAVTSEVETAKNLLRKRKKKKADKGPFYQKTWFLAACLLLLLGLVSWSLMPLSEDELYRRAEALMKTNDATQWDVAHQKYLKPLQERFPESKYKEQSQQWLEQIEMTKAEEQLELAARLGREPKDTWQALYMKAQSYEKFGDRVTALEHYNSIVQLLNNEVKARPYVNLARRQIARLQEAGGGKDDRLKFIQEELLRADQLFTAGKTLEAHNIWKSIETLYSNNQELAPLVAQAQERLSGKKVEE